MIKPTARADSVWLRQVDKPNFQQLMLDLEMQSCTWPRGLLKKSPRRMNHTFLFLMELLGRQGKQTHTQAR